MSKHFRPASNLQPFSLTQKGVETFKHFGLLTKICLTGLVLSEGFRLHFGQPKLLRPFRLPKILKRFRSIFAYVDRSIGP